MEFGLKRPLMLPILRLEMYLTQAVKITVRIPSGARSVSKALNIHTGHAF